MPIHIPIPPSVQRARSPYRDWSEIRAEVLQVADDMGIPLNHAMRYVLEQDRISMEEME